MLFNHVRTMIQRLAVLRVDVCGALPDTMVVKHLLVSCYVLLNERSPRTRTTAESLFPCYHASPSSVSKRGGDRDADRARGIGVDGGIHSHLPPSFKRAEKPVVQHRRVRMARNGDELLQRIHPRHRRV